MSENNDRGLHKSVINWFPGHMTKAKREMQEKIRYVDMVIELRDARIPKASANPLLDELCGHKPRLIILTKKDKAEAAVTETWLAQLSQAEQKAIALDLMHDDLGKILIGACQTLMKQKREKQQQRGIRPTAIKAMVVGVPNVGKSTLINRLAKRKVAKTGDRPGVTRALQWVKVSSELELLDTPGVLWPKFDDASDGYVLAITGAIRDEILPIEDVTYFAMEYLLREYPELLTKRYRIEGIEDPYQAILALGRNRGFLRSGNVVDETRAMQTLLREIRSDALGAISWEKPE